MQEFWLLSNDPRTTFLMNKIILTVSTKYIIIEGMTIMKNLQ
jgi:hypothetical protein